MLPRNTIVFSEGYGEDWDRLVEFIQKDPKVENRERVLEIIRTVDIFDGREKQLMDLNGGRPYLYMLENLFPLLRRSEYRIEYAVPEFSLEKGKQLLETKPDMLSLMEMYQIAHTYEKGSEAFNRVFKIAAQTYPSNPVAQNNLGVVYMSELRLNEAEQCFFKAYSAGIKEAASNLEILYQLKEAMQ